MTLELFDHPLIWGCIKFLFKFSKTLLSRGECLRGKQNLKNQIKIFQQYITCFLVEDFIIFTPHKFWYMFPTISIVRFWEYRELLLYCTLYGNIEKMKKIRKNICWNTRCLWAWNLDSPCPNFESKKFTKLPKEI